MGYEAKEESSARVSVSAHSGHNIYIQKHSDHCSNTLADKR